MDDLKTAMTDTGWTVDALAKHYAIDRSYVVRMLSREKPMTSDRIAELPADLAARFDAIRAERHGVIVVTPLRGLDAQKALVAGLVGLMSQPLPERAERMVRMSDTGSEKKTRTA